MGTTTIKSIIEDRLDKLLFDATQVRWPKATRVMWLSDGVRAVSVMRLDANVVTAQQALDAGTKQQLPPDGIRLGSIGRNIVAGAPGKTIQATTVDVMDVDPGWHTVTQASEIVCWMPDPDNPKSFFVYPPAVAGTKIEVTYSAIPAAISAGYSDTDTFPLGDEFVDAAIEWVLFRAYGELNTVEYSGLAEGHLNKFANMLGVTQAKAKAAKYEREAS